MTRGCSSMRRLAGVFSCVAGVATTQRIVPQHRSLDERVAPVEVAPRALLVEDDVDNNDDIDEAAAQEDAAVDDLVRNTMPGLSDKIELVHHAGRISLDKSKRNNIFYWHFAAATEADKAPLVIWLNGGPGCSSMQGLFLGVSPFQIEDESTISINKHSWHYHANLLFIDQPVGTGMSYTRGNDYRTDEETVAKDFHAFLTKFFQRHPEYLSAESASGVRTTRDLYIFGESHAGRFIPQFSQYIVGQNKVIATSGEAGDGEGISISLKGVGIGNGWVHPFIQYDYSDFAHGLGLVTYGQVRALKSAFLDCQNALLSGKFLATTCFENMNSILDGLRNTRASSSKSLNYYDVRQYVQRVSAYPAQRQFIGAYLNQLQVRQRLHANDEESFRFRGCSDAVYDGLRQFDGVSTLESVQRLLAGGLRVLFYNGQWDMMCNHYGTEKLLLHLDWNGSAAYQEAKKYTWSVAGRSEPAGFAQQGGNLTYIVIPGAGHMVPMDVPDVASEMVRRFMSQQGFDDSPQLVKSLKTNSTNLETTQCEASIATVAKSNADNLTWLWVALVVAVVGSLLVFCVSVMCRRGGRKARHSEHSIVIQESDDEEPTDLEKRGGRSVNVGKRDDDDDDDDDADDDDSGDELQEVSIRSRG